MSSTVREAIFWIAVVCCTLAQVVIVWTAIRRPALPSDAAVLSDPLRRPRRAGEIAWTIIPALGLLLILIVTWRATSAP